MAVDSAGYSTTTAATNPFAATSLFSATDYDPSQSALTSGLQSAATYDPTNNTNASNSSVAGYLSAQNSQNKLAQDSASTTQNTSNSAAQASSPDLTAANKAAYSTYTTTANKAAANSAAGTTYTVSQGSAGAPTAAVAPNAVGNSQATNNLTSYGGPSVVSVATGAGNYAYYSFDQNSGTYVFQGTYDKNGQATTSWTTTPYQANNPNYTYGLNPAMNGINGGINGPGGIGASLGYQVGDPVYYIDPTGSLSAAQRAGATLTNVGIGQSLTDEQASGQAGVNAINTAYAKQIGGWNTANQTAAANNQTAAATAQASALQQQALDWLTTHNGQLSPYLQGYANTNIVGSNPSIAANQAAIAAAQQAYQGQLTQAATLRSLQPAAIDTSNIDNTNQQTLNSLISQYATSGAGGLASRAAGNQAASLMGQNQLTHDSAAATQYDTNLSAFGNALASQNSADAQATGNQLYTDIQSVSDTAAALQQEMGQLGTQAGQQAQTQLDYLNQQVAQYQAAVQAYGQSSSQAITLAKGILGAASTVAAAVA